MAGNGPFPFTVFFVDDGENNDDYGIISNENSQTWDYCRDNK